MQLYEILQHILNHHSEEEWEKNDFFFMVRMIDSLYGYEDDPPILCDTIKKYMNRLQLSQLYSSSIKLFNIIFLWTAPFLLWGFLNVK